MNASTRIVVVGGGIVAASVAYHLARQGTSVVVVEADLPGPATAAGAGIICPWNIRGDDAHFRLCAEGARYYPELLAMLAEDGQTDTGYAKVGALCVGQDTGRLAAVADLLRARQASWPEIGEVSPVGEGEPRRRFPPLAAGLSGVWVSGGARVDGRLIRDCLLHAAAEYGALRMPGTAVLEQSGGRVTGVTVGPERVRADAVVVAAGAWTAQVCAGVGWELPVGPQRGQIVHALLSSASTAASGSADADTAGWPVILPPHDPYLLGFPGGRVVLGATREDAGFDYRVTLAGVRSMLTAAAEIAPGLSDATLLETRVGFRPATSDGRPLIGVLADGLIVATGNGPEGLTAGPWTGLAAAALALGQQPAADIGAFDPARFRPAAASGA